MGSIGAAVGSAVAGSVANKVLGGGKKSSSGGGTQHSTSEVLIPDYLQDIIKGDQGLVNRANEYFTQPYEAYEGQRFADFSPDQLQAFQGVRDMLGQYSPYVQQGFGLTQAAGQRAQDGFVTPDRIQEFMSPYQQNVTDIAKREASRDFEQELNRIGDVAATAGAFGGDRMGVLESEAYRNLGQRLDDIQATGSQNAFDRATQLALQTGTAEAGLLGQLGGQLTNQAQTAQGYDLAGLGALQQIGGQQQALEQLGRDFDYEQFIEEREYPNRQLTGLANIVYPLLGGSGNVQTENFIPGISTGQAALGGAAIGSSLFNSLGQSSQPSSVDIMGTLGQQQNLYSGLGSIGGLGSSGGGSGGFFSGISNFFGFKEGGMVPSTKKYANGGSVLSSLLENQNALQQTPQYETAGNTFQSLRDLIRSEHGMAPEVPQEAPEAPEKIVTSKLLDRLQKYKGLSGIREITPKEKSNTPEKTVSAVFTNEPQKRSGLAGLLDEADTPLLTMGAAILADQTGNPMRALASGLGSYIQARGAESEAAMAREKLKFDQIVDMMNSRTAKANADIAKQRFEFEKRMQPLEASKTLAQIQKLQAEANQKQNPAAKIALEATQKYVENNPYQSQEDVLNFYQTQLETFNEISGTPTRPQQSQPSQPSSEDPLGLL